jgi:hypothetical protein
VLVEHVTPRKASNKNANTRMKVEQLVANDDQWK